MSRGIQTVGTTEAILQILAIWQTWHGERPFLIGEIWSRLVKFMETSPRSFTNLELSGRIAGGLNSEEPNPEFLGELTELLQYGFIRLHEEGLFRGHFEVTPSGWCLTRARELRDDLKPLEIIMREP